MIFGSKKTRRNTHEGKKTEGKSRIFLGFFYNLLLVAFLGVIVYVFLFSSFPSISNVYLSGVEELEYGEIMDKINSYREGRYLNAIPRNNIITLPKGKISRQLLEDFKKIERVEIRKEFPDTLFVEIKERDSLLIWCSQGSCYLVDQNGLAYSDADFESDEIKENNLVVIINEGGEEVSREDSVIDPGYIEFVTDFSSRVEKEVGIKIKRELTTPRAVSGDIRAETQEGWRILLSKDLGAEKEIRMLNVVLDKNISEEQRKNLEYIDLRTENKVYYKFKKEDEESKEENESDDSEKED